MGTTTKGYPYPEPTDPIAQGAQAIQDLAAAVDTRLGVMAAGVASVVLSTAALTGTVSVTFPAGRFTAVPAITVTSVGGGNTLLAFVGASPTASGCIVGVMRRDGANVAAGTFQVSWIAVQSG